LMSHKSGKQVRRLRKKSILKVSAEAHRLRRVLHTREGSQPQAIAAARQSAMALEAEALALLTEVLPIEALPDSPPTEPMS